MSHHRDLNAEINLWGEDGELQLHKDKEAVREFFIGEDGVNANTWFFHDLEEKANYLIKNGYWRSDVALKYGFKALKSLMKHAYLKRFRFKTLMGAEKFYGQYAMRDITGKHFLERYEDRVVMVALAFSDDLDHAFDVVDEIISGRFQPATPTFLNAGRVRAGAPVSCFLLRLEDNMESIARGITDSLQLSKRGGGVALLLSNIREEGAPIKEMQNQSSGIIPVMKMLEDAFSYANQLGARQGAGAVYLNAHHPDIMKFLDTKRENADEKIRIKTLSLGVVIPDITLELAKNDEDMYLFSPYDVERFYGKPFADISVTEEYKNMVENPNIRKSKIRARKFFQTLAEVQFESGYPYIMYEDTANRWNPAPNIGRITMSNLCVAPETRLLTDKGYVEIQDVEGTYVNAWNGEKFSKSYVEKTGENQELITVNFSNGASLGVTPYHKFYVKTGYGNRRVDEVRAGELKPGDKLDKFELSVVDNPEAEDMKYAYTAGLFTSEGTYASNGTPVLRLYDKKKELVDHIDYLSSSLKPDASGRISLILHNDIAPKFTVPTDASLRSRLEWLAGVIDGDGYGNGIVGIQIGSIHPEYLEELRVLLTTLGVHARWTKVRDAEKQDFGDGYGPYESKTFYRLVISGTDAQKLRELGLPTKRVIIEPYEHQRAANAYIKVESVVATGRISDTYCLNEPEKHKVVFEGIQTGNCSEILQPQVSSKFNTNGFYDEVGRDISCNLGSMNVAKMAELDNRKEFEHSVDVAYRFLTNVSEEAELDSVPSVDRGNRGSRAIGLGQMNLHGFFIEQGIDYDSEEAREFWRSYMSDITYSVISASLRKAQEEGETFEGFEGSHWQTGEQIQKILDFGTSSRFGISEEEWKVLKTKVGIDGLYNRNLQAIPPTGSISYINNSTASIHPVTSKIEIRKEGKTGRIYYPAYGMNSDNHKRVKTAYEYGPNAVIDMYAISAPFVDQGQSMTLFFRDTATTRDINRAQIRAWTKGVKSIYYIRLLQEALAGTEVEGCVSCAL